MLIFLGCSHSGGAPTNSADGTVLIKMSNGIRSIQPAMTFVKYTISFMNKDGTNAPDETVENNSVEVVLKAGLWNIAITGFVEPDDGTAELVAAAQGNTEVTVEAGKTTRVDLVLDKNLPANGGVGILSWDISFPDPIASAELSILSMGSDSNFTEYRTIDLSKDEKSISLPSGYYKINITLDAEYCRTEVVYIYPHLRTSIPPIVFSSDFSEEMANIIFNVSIRDYETMEVKGLLSEPIILSRSRSEYASSEATLRVQGFPVVQCYIDGKPLNDLSVTENEKTFLIKAEEFPGTQHFITFIGIRNNILYGREIALIIEPENTNDREEIITEFSGSAELSTWLASLPENTQENPYRVKISNINLGSRASTNSLQTLYDALSRYVILDLSGCTGSNYINVNTEKKKKIVSIALPQSIAIIETNAFLDCTALISAELPNVTSIGHMAFGGCSNLESVLMPEILELTNTVATASTHGAFYNCVSLKSVSMPKATAIQRDSFYKCTALTSISLPQATVIGEGTFRHCDNLLSVSIPKAAFIGDNAFNDCKKLESVTLGSEPPELDGNSVFASGKPLYGIYVPASAISTYQNTTKEYWTPALKDKVKEKE
jgi:hypothetical protein